MFCANSTRGNMPTGNSDLVESLDELQARLRPTLKESGFSARGRAFNCTTSDGLIQVVKLQMGRFDPPGTTYVPGLRENLYGRFTINLGVFVPEVASQNDGQPSRSFVHEYHCCLRTRLPIVGPEGRDVWWDIRPDDALAQELLLRLRRDSIPFFTKFGTRDAILNQLSDVSRSPYTTIPRIICAIILAGRGRNEDARGLLAAQARETSIPGHAAHVRRLADRLGLGELDP